jgi:hypothetical protein
MKFIETSKGCGLIIPAPWSFVKGEVPQKDGEDEFLSWCYPDDPMYKEYKEHCLTLV